MCCQGRFSIRSRFNNPRVLFYGIIDLQQLLQFRIQRLISITILGQQYRLLIILRVLFFLGQAVETQVYALAISRVYKFCSSTTTSRSQCLSSLFLRDYRLLTSFTFSRYSYREGPIRFTYSSLLIRLNSIVLIEYISALEDLVLSSSHI